MRSALADGEKTGSAFRLVLPREAMRGANGTRAGSGAGSSLDFLDFREYHPGDDLRRIDWGVFARSDREVVRLYREEILPRLDIVLDVSPSMNITPAKARATHFLAAALAAAARAGGVAASLWTARPPSAGFEFVDGSATLPPSVWPIPPTGRPRTLPRNAMRLFLSDLLWPEEPEHLLRHLADGAAALHLVQVLDPEDAAPSEGGPARLVDSESGEARDLLPDAAATAAYRDAFAAHRARWDEAARRHGSRVIPVIADGGDPLLPLLRAGILEAGR